MAVTDLWGTEPLVLALELVHDLVKLVEILVAEEVVVNEVELTTGVRKGVAIALTGEIHPPGKDGVSRLFAHVKYQDALGVTELVAFKVQVRLTAQGVYEETDLKSAK
jgi:hypothetical protein